jgi:hypothetical protein
MVKKYMAVAYRLNISGASMLGRKI